MSRPLLPLLALAALAACKSSVPQEDKEWAFACPPREASVTYDDGRSLTFTGADPADANICLADAGGRPVRLIFGVVEEGPNEGRGHREGMNRLFPARENGNADYQAIVVSPGSGIQYPYGTRWRVLGFEQLQVPAGSFAVVGLERQVTATPPNNQQITFRYWLDQGSGIVVKRQVEVLRGSSLQRGYQATRLTLPPPPPPPPAPAGPPRG